MIFKRLPGVFPGQPSFYLKFNIRFFILPALEPVIYPTLPPTKLPIEPSIAPIAVPIAVPFAVPFAMAINPAVVDMVVSSIFSIPSWTDSSLVAAFPKIFIFSIFYLAFLCDSLNFSNILFSILDTRTCDIPRTSETCV